MDNKELILLLERLLKDIKIKEQTDIDQIKFEQYVADKLKQIANDVELIKKSII